MFDFTSFEEKIGVTFDDKRLLQLAFTHRSFVNENRSVTSEHNERLEFLGDAVLELATTDYLFRTFPKKPEGELTSYRAALVNTNMLAKVATDLGMNEHLLLSKGESKDTGRARQYILANTFEALLGAVYMDQGYKVAEGVVLDHVLIHTDKMISNQLWKDAKSRLQEKAQEVLSVTPRYEIHEEKGPDHLKEFVVGAYLGGDMVSEGRGVSKQDAEQEAAKKALDHKGW